MLQITIKVCHAVSFLLGGVVFEVAIKVILIKFFDEPEKSRRGQTHLDATTTSFDNEITPCQLQGLFVLPCVSKLGSVSTSYYLKRKCDTDSLK